MAPTRDVITFRTSLFQILLKNIFIAKIIPGAGCIESPVTAELKTVYVNR